MWSGESGQSANVSHLELTLKWGSSYPLNFVAVHLTVEHSLPLATLSYSSTSKHNLELNKQHVKVSVLHEMLFAANTMRNPYGLHFAYPSKYLDSNISRIVMTLKQNEFTSACVK